MMTSPESYAQMHEDDTYEELMETRDSLLEEIRRFELDRAICRETTVPLVTPFPEVVYQCNLEYLAEICKLISSKFRDLINQEAVEEYENDLAQQEENSLPGSAPQ